jgi:hypothetical protein
MVLDRRDVTLRQAEQGRIADETRTRQRGDYVPRVLPRPDALTGQRRYAAAQ